MITISSRQVGEQPPAAGDPDEALSLRLRDLALVELDALCAGGDGARAAQLAGAYADDVADALREARTRLGALRGQLAGPDPLNVLDLAPRQRSSDSGAAGSARVRDRLIAQADAARAYARLGELAAGLVPKLFEAERRR
ncbi:MAG TPA: hypothetical protein VMJ10_15900 [Kofleriaceae bacterium]|nr:hypothetical protein [Kofleriaceae bacterium]